MNPLEINLIICAGVCVGVWLLSIFTGDTSWVDRIWSIIPFVYLWVFAFDAHLHSITLNLMAVVATIWGARLTFNFARKGGYSGMEDYRWEVLRQSMTKTQFQLFNIFFITIYQNILLLLITLPAWTVYQDHPGSWVNTTSSPTVSVWVYVIAILFVLCTLGETIADQQQWNFHKTKHAELAAGQTPTANFLTTGLFRYSRHPNYFFEIAQWWLMYFIAAVAVGSLWQWTVLGAVLLSLLFEGSTRFTEKISRSKYPEYADYQASTSAVIPWFNKRKTLSAGS